MERLTRITRYLLNMLIPVCGWLLLYFMGIRLVRFFMPFVIGWVIAMIANPLVHFLEKRLRVVRKHSSMVIVVLVLGLVIGLIYLFFSKLINEVVQLIRDLPEIYELAKVEVQLAIDRISHLFRYLPAGVQNFFNQFGENVGQYVGGLVQTIASPTVTMAGNVAKQIPGMLVGFIIIVMSSYFFIVERNSIMAGISRITPEWVKQYIRFLKGDVRKLIGGYFLAQFRIMFVVAIVLAIGFLVLGVQYSIFLAAVIAFLDFLPVLGTGTILGPWAVIKLLSGEYAFAAGLILLYLLTQVVRQVIQPKIVGDTMGLAPLTTLFLLYIGFKAGGLAGMILAVPVGLFFGSLYRYGAFDTIINNTKLLVKEINLFRNEGS